MEQKLVIHCSHISTCEMYELFRRSGTLKLWQIQYCEGDYEQCARYSTACEGKQVPRNLLPNGKRLPGAPT